MRLRKTELLGGLFLFTAGCHGEVQLGKEHDPNTGAGGADGGVVADSGGSGAIGAASGGLSGFGGALGNGGSLGSDGSLGGGSETQCEGSCCPTDPSCYSTSAGNGSPGSECLATRDNTLTPNRIQLRQMWLNPTSPAGLQQSIVYQTLNDFTTLSWSNCGFNGNSGYIELRDFDLDAGTLRTGFSNFLQSPNATPQLAAQDAIRDGFCMAKTSAPWDSIATPSTGPATDLGIPQSDLYVPSASNLGGAYPVGLPLPMGKGWNAGPAVAKRVAVDFDLSATAAPIAGLAATPTSDLTKFKNQREELLARLDATTGDLGMAGYTGVFFFDSVTKHAHGYSPVGWQILYDEGTPTDYELIPIREAEINSDFNDPAHPNCVGEYNGDTLAQSSCNPGGSPTTAGSNAWSNPGKPADGTVPGSTKGYFLIVELEQIWSHVLSQSLCFLYPTGPVSLRGGWGTTDSQLCRTSTNWNPSDPVKGIPMGDWCSYDNSAAHDNCHDAYRTVTYQAFAASNVKDGTCDVATPAQ